MAHSVGWTPSADAAFRIGSGAGFLRGTESPPRTRAKYGRRPVARRASTSATHASRVSRSVPSMSKRTARSRGTSRLLLSEPPDVVAHMVSGLDRLAFLLAGHRGSVHDRAPDRERPAVLLVPDPDDVARANPGVCVHDARRHHVRPVVDEPHGSHVDRDGPLLRGEGEQPADRRRDAAFEEDRDRVVPPQQQAVRPGLRLVERGVVQRNLHAELIFEPAEEVRRLLPAEPGAPTDLRGHSDSGTRPGKIILVWASRYLSMQTIEVSRTQRPRTAGPEHATKSDPVAVPGRPSFARGCPAPTSARRAPHHTIHPGLPDSARGPRRTRPWPASVDPDATGTRPFAGTRGRGRPWSHESRRRSPRAPPPSGRGRREDPRGGEVPRRPAPRFRRGPRWRRPVCRGPSGPARVRVPRRPSRGPPPFETMLPHPWPDRGPGMCDRPRANPGNPLERGSVTLPPGRGRPPPGRPAAGGWKAGAMGRPHGPSTPQRHIRRSPRRSAPGPRAGPPDDIGAPRSPARSPEKPGNTGALPRSTVPPRARSPSLRGFSRETPTPRRTIHSGSACCSAHRAPPRAARDGGGLPPSPSTRGRSSG